VEDFKKLKNELQNIVAGNELEGQTSLIKAAQNHLRKSFATSKGFKNQKPSKSDEERALIEYATSNNLVLLKFDIGIYTKVWPLL
jgi:hypothetical protein